MTDQILAIIIVTVLFQFLIQFLNASRFAYRLWRGRKPPFMPALEMSPALANKSQTCEHPHFSMQFRIEKWVKDPNRYTIGYNAVCTACATPMRFHGAIGANADLAWVHDDTRTQINVQAFIPERQNVLQMVRK